MRPLLAALLLLCAPAESRSEGKKFLDSAEILAALPGMTMTGHYADGVKFTETYAPDNRIAYQDDRGSDTGKWFEKDGMFCTFYLSLNGACFKVVRTGANCYEYYVAEGQDGEVSEPASHWNSVGWDVAKPSTCDLSDKVVRAFPGAQQLHSSNSEIFRNSERILSGRLAADHFEICIAAEPHLG